MKIEITKTIEIPFTIEATILPEEKETCNYPGCSPEPIDLEPRIVAEDVFKKIYEYMDENKAEIDNELRKEAERLKEFDKEL